MGVSVMYGEVRPRSFWTGGDIVFVGGGDFSTLGGVRNIVGTSIRRDEWHRYVSLACAFA